MAFKTTCNKIMERKVFVLLGTRWTKPEDSEYLTKIQKQAERT